MFTPFVSSLNGSAGRLNNSPYMVNKVSMVIRHLFFTNLNVFFFRSFDKKSSTEEDNPYLHGRHDAGIMESEADSESIVESVARRRRVEVVRRMELKRLTRAVLLITKFEVLARKIPTMAWIRRILGVGWIRDLSILPPTMTGMILTICLFFSETLGWAHIQGMYNIRSFDLTRP